MESMIYLCAQSATFMEFFPYLLFQIILVATCEVEAKLKLAEMDEKTWQTRLTPTLACP